MKILYPADCSDRIAGIAAAEIRRLELLVRMLEESEVIIVTCGNVIDYFMAAPGMAGEPGPAVAPKFFAISANEDIDLRQHLTQQIRAAGAVFRMGSYQETLAALRSQHEAIRTLNPTAHVLYTLSPVPIDSAIGIKGAGSAGAVELDCISKSSLRVALAEFLGEQSSDANLHYFPSFEIVRWIAPCAGGAVFGNEDAASRHVSQDVLEGVYRYFRQKHCTE